MSTCSLAFFNFFIIQVMQSPGNLQPSIAQQSQQTGQQQSGQSGTNPQGQVRRSLTLTKDQMMEAQEMFRTANKVTRPEKALILGFMAGSRENPCPHLGKELDVSVRIPRL
jgi:negative elongation factor A